jgi:hypothetical protein
MYYKELSEAVWPDYSSVSALARKQGLTEEQEKEWHEIARKLYRQGIDDSRDDFHENPATRAKKNQESSVHGLHHK